MVETDRTDSSQARADARAAFSPTRRRHDPVAQWDRDDARAEHRASLFAEDSAILIGILMGGTAGYLVASYMRKSELRSREVRRVWDRTGPEHNSALRSATSSVEADETTDLIASTKVEGTAVYNQQGDKLGEVYNFMVGKRSGRVAYAVMSFGGFLGIGQKYHALPWNALTYHTSKGGYVIDADRDRLLRAPSFAAGEDPFANPSHARDVQEFWSSGMI